MVERKITQMMFVAFALLTGFGCLWNAVGGLVKVLAR